VIAALVELLKTSDSEELSAMARRLGQMAAQLLQN